MNEAQRPTDLAGRTAAFILAAAVAAMPVGCARPSWRQQIDEILPLMGHRNWIVIADSAYPAQSRGGIQTSATRAEHLQVVEAVVAAVERTPHVRARIYVDAEMQHVPENYAPGIEAYRSKLAEVLGARAVKAVPHEELIARLDEAAKTFNVLILKTDLALPYTSVFVELDCGYWSAEAEAALRESMRSAGAK
ncbi:MAG: RbsD/FucU domain-containing protein [Planctomycetota bacterium]|jgi:L-fucose mutarotase/ribose pyranase (RbsD/FucU family)